MVYVESADADKIEKLARSEGKTLVEWARETLLGELEANSAVRTKRAVPVARWRTMPHEVGPGGSGTEPSRGVPEDGASKRLERQEEPSALRGDPKPGVLAERRVGNHPKERDTAAHSEAESSVTRSIKTCKHGTAKGHNCWQCGGMAVME